MDPKDVNRINYNNYYVGQNLDFLIRSKMRSESLSTPLTNTPVFYDDQVSSKMALLGKRGYYDPGYIYGFDEKKNEKPDNRNINLNPNSHSPPKYPPPYNLNEREQFMNNQNRRENLNEKELYELEMRRQNEMQRNRMNEEEFNNKNNNLRERNYDMRNERNQYDNQEFQNDMRQRNYEDPPGKNNNFRNDENFQREYNDYLNKGYNQVGRDNFQENNNDLNLPKTREQIQHDVYIENFKRQQLAKQMMMEDEMKYKENYFKQKK